MTTLIKLSLAVLIAIASANTFAQTILVDSIKTVTVYSSKSFFKDYPVDSIVANLNSLNNTQKIKYYKRTEDNSRTGLQADYTIDLNISARKGDYIEPTYTTVTQSVPYYSSDTAKQNSIPEYRNEQASVQTFPGRYSPDQYLMEVMIVANTKRNKKLYKTFTGEDSGSPWFNKSLEFSNQIPTIVELEKYLLAYFSK